MKYHPHPCFSLPATKKRQEEKTTEIHEALDRADPSGWAARLRCILRCPALVSAVVGLGSVTGLVIGALSTLGWTKMGAISEKADKAGEQAARSDHRMDLLEQKIQGQTDQLGAKMDAILDAVQRTVRRTTP